MIGSKVAVVGGGISGLSYAYFFNQHSQKILSLRTVMPKVTVFEASNIPGGWVQSVKDENTDAVFEHGPRSYRALGMQARTVLALAEELKLQDEIIFATLKSAAAKNRYIYMNQQLNRLKMNFTSLFFKQPPLLSESFLRLARHEIRTPRPNPLLEDESMYDFISRRGSKELAENLADPFIRGILAGDIRNTSMVSFAPRLKDIEDQYGSVLKNYKKVPEISIGESIKQSKLCRKAYDQRWSIWSFKNGARTLPNAVYDALTQTEDVDIKMNSKVNEMKKNEDGTISIRTADGHEGNFDVVVSCINAEYLSSVLSKHHTELSQKLSQFTSVDVATTCLEYDKSTCTLPQGFGHLIPSGEKEKNLGVIYDSVVFPQHDRTDNSTVRLSVMMGGAWFNEVFGDRIPTQQEVTDVAVQAVGRQLGFNSDPVSCQSNIIHKAIPQYPVGHKKLATQVHSQIQQDGLPLTVIGPSFDRPGLNDCIHNAKAHAMSLLNQLEFKDYKEKIGEDSANGEKQV